MPVLLCSDYRLSLLEISPASPRPTLSFHSLSLGLSLGLSAGFQLAEFPVLVDQLVVVMKLGQAILL